MALVVERDDEQVLAFELLEHVRRVAPLQHRIAQRSAHRREDGGPEQELELARFDATELLGSQIVRDEAVVAPERRDRNAVVVQRQGREAQAGGPPLGTRVQRFGLILGHVGARRGEERVRLDVGQGQLGGPELEQLPLCTKPRDAQPSLRAPAEHQLRASRHVEEQRGDDVEALMVLELVHVVQDEHERPRAGGQRRYEARDSTRPQRVAGTRQRLEQGGVGRRTGVQCLGDVRQEDDGIVVPVVERHPGEFATVACRPLPEERGLAVTRGCDDADDATAAVPGETADERGALDQTWPRRRNGKLGRQQFERDSISRPGRSFPCPVCADAAR